MFRPAVGKNELISLIEDMSELDVARFLYFQEMAATYLSVGKFESMLISAMHMCDRVKVQKALGLDEDAWALSVAKKSQLEGSTLGSLIKILERHNVDPADIAYLRWIKDKRDYFVHRLFHDHAWPGEMDAESCQFMRRRLLAIQLWLERGERKIWRIFERAGFIELDHLEDGGLLVMNSGIYDLIQADITKLGSEGADA